MDAVLIFERNDRLRWLLESHLLLPVVTSDLSSKLGLSPTTIEYYGLWFFDVRSRLSKSGWISGWVLGGTPWNGFADDDLAPVWRRMAYHSRNERVLDVTVAVTTGAGRDRFPEAECDRIQYLVEQMRLSPAIDPDRVLQIARRLEAERNGEPPSSYHVPRKSRVPAPARLRADPHAIPAS